MGRTLVTSDELRDVLDDVRVIDFRWYLDDASKGRREYEAGHVPGAVFVDLEDVTGEGHGRHPLPSRAQFERAMRKRGRGAEPPASSSTTMRVARWRRASGGSCKIHGHDASQVLDGGIQAWRTRSRDRGRTSTSSPATSSRTSPTSPMSSPTTR